MKNNILWMLVKVILALAEIVAATWLVSAIAIPAIIARKIFEGMSYLLTAWIWAYWGFSHLHELEENR